ncbi:alpha/beta hydrolase [Micromonospora coerulea]|uniref:Alpha/beta hydrolase n=1 Tax=Micromonospora coerulea TaxID=47856 RepID=A0ABP8S7C0_9ACTN
MVRDLTLPGPEELSVRLYRPTLEPRPLVVYLHGGGFVTGDLDSHDRICRRLAEVVNVAVLAVHYRRAPEHPAPAAVEDVVRVVGWAAEHLQDLGGDSEMRIALAGDSAGAALAVLAAVRLRDGDGPPVSALLLVCPNADMTLSMPSVQEQGHGWGLDAEDLAWLVEQWVPNPRQRADPAVSPLYAPLHGLPPTVLATAEHDPLRDEGDALAARMAQAGIYVRHLRHTGLVHGFLSLDHVSPAAAVVGDNLFREFGALIWQRREGQPGV